uniref:HTH psq-type domain-containing protein n=1 Tax=Steinernema glaseri TaxID=37863 RepID=A0A1I7ZYP5_9BILA
MAALCGLRCSSERRSYCRELQRWNRSMLLAVGLETVFQRYAKDADPFGGADTKVSSDYAARDWKEATTCEVCKCRRTSSATETTSDEVPEKPKTTAFSISDLTKSKSFPSQPKNDFDPFNPFMKGFGTPATSFPPNAWTPTMFGMIPNPMIQSLHSYFGLDYRPPPFPMPFPPTWPSQSTLNGMLAAALSDSKRKEKPRKEKTEAPKEKEPEAASEEQPLDLSSKSTIKIVVEDVSSESPSDSPPMTMKIDTKQENGLAPPKMPIIVGTKRNYSQLDLEKAVLDIRSGRLGTRRASVVYGIPRSTLRNKIYKLEAAAELNGEPSQYKRRRAGGQTLQERLTAGESVREAQRAMSAVPDTAWPLLVTPSKTESPPSETSTLLEELKMNSAEKEEARNRESTPSSAGEASSKYSKKTRPKRGHYRQYGKSKLEEAVQTVRRGEMSVHKAGSLFGVPHSTLEYKVKERNLLRNKKRCAEEEAKEKEPEPPETPLVQAP